MASCQCYHDPKGSLQLNRSVSLTHLHTSLQPAILLCILMGMRWQWEYACPEFQYRFCTGGTTTSCGFILLSSRTSGDFAAQGGAPRQRAMQRSSSC